MSTSICNSFSLQEQTRLKIKITQQSNCNFSVEDVSDNCYSPPLRYGFHPEIPDNYNLPQGQYRRSWGYFVNVFYANQYDLTYDVCHQIQQAQTLVFENGSNELIPKEYGLSTDGWYTVYRFFILKEEVFNEIYQLYTGDTVIIQRNINNQISLYKAIVPVNIQNIEYTPIQDIAEVVAIYENTTPDKVVGIQVKEEFVSTCYLTSCYNNLNLMILESITNPCLSGTKTIGSTSIFGMKSGSCDSMYGNPLFSKREILFIILSAIKIFVQNCDFCKAQKLIQEIIGVNTNCNQFYFLCGDTPEYNKVSKGCGCK